MDARGPGRKDGGRRPGLEDRHVSDGDIKELKGHSVEQAHPWEAENNDRLGGRRL